MSDAPPSPRARRLATPGWLDGRLLLGVLLVLVSVIIGARVLSAADRTQAVWSAAHDLAPGSPVEAGDLTPIRVRLFDSGARYLSADRPAPAGYLLRRAVSAGELVPVDALAAAGRDVEVRLVTVAVARGHLPPDLRADQQVDVHMTPDVRRPVGGGAATGPTSSPSPRAAVPEAGAPRLVLAGVPVVRRESVEGLGAGGQAEPVVLQVRPDQVAPLLRAVAEGTIDLVGVPQAAEVEPSLVATR